MKYTDKNGEVVTAVKEIHHYTVTNETGHTYGVSFETFEREFTPVSTPKTTKVVKEEIDDRSL